MAKHHAFLQRPGEWSMEKNIFFYIKKLGKNMSFILANLIFEWDLKNSDHSSKIASFVAIYLRSI
jgi:hypothetical protein